MNIEYHKWWSSSLEQDMELKIYGYYGKPVLVFPAQGGKFYEFEDFGMVEAIKHLIDGGRIKVFTIDSIDNQSWANMSVQPADRALRHQDYDRYVTEEVVPFIRKHCQNDKIKTIASGVSLGGYHAANFFFRHPDLFSMMVSISGLYQLNHFIGDYMDDNVYFNTPLAYLPRLDDSSYLDQYRQSRIVACSGQGAYEEAMLKDTLELKRVLEEKNIPAWIDIWGYDVNHDWPWWRKMLPYFLEQLV